MRLLRKTWNTYFSPHKSFVQRFQRTFGFTPKNPGIFKMAFHHKSGVENTSGLKQNNERLEYLGDSILSTVVAEYLFKKYPNKNEGFLTKMRSKIVKRKSLNLIADRMGIDVIMSQFNNAKISQSMLGNALEALIGAVYLDIGFQGTRDFIVHKILREYIDFNELETTDDNYKSQLLEYCQKHGKAVDFRTIQKYRYDKRDRFKVGVYIDGSEISTAEDFNKKSAEQVASGIAMKQISFTETKVS